MRVILSILLLFLSLVGFSQNLDWFESEASQPSFDGVAWYPMNESSGTAIIDSTTNNLDGTLLYGVTINGDYYSFDGTDDYCTVDDNDLLSFVNPNPLSVSFWLDADNYDNWPCFVEKRYEYSIYVINGELVCRIYENGGSGYIGKKSTVTPSTTGWHHVVLTYTGGDYTSSIHMYVDGVDTTGDDSSSLGSLSTGIVNTTNILRIGRAASGNKYDGLLDDVRIYDYELSSTQVSTIYTNGRQ